MNSEQETLIFACNLFEMLVCKFLIRVFFSEIKRFRRRQMRKVEEYDEHSAVQDDYDEHSAVHEDYDEHSAVHEDYDEHSAVQEEYDEHSAVQEDL